LIVRILKGYQEAQYSEQAFLQMKRKSLLPCTNFARTTAKISKQKTTKTGNEEKAVTGFGLLGVRFRLGSRLFRLY
jgi:hypothetical protein